MCSALQCSAVQRSVVQCSAVQCSEVPDRYDLTLDTFWRVLLYRCYYPHTPRDSVSPVCGIFFYFYTKKMPPKKIAKNFLLAERKKNLARIFFRSIFFLAKHFLLTKKKLLVQANMRPCKIQCTLHWFAEG